MAEKIVKLRVKPRQVSMSHLRYLGLTEEERQADVLFVYCSLAQFGGYVASMLSNVELSAMPTSPDVLLVNKAPATNEIYVHDRKLPE